MAVRSTLQRLIVLTAARLWPKKNRRYGRPNLNRLHRKQRKLLLRRLLHLRLRVRSRLRVQNPYLNSRDAARAVKRDSRLGQFLLCI